MKQVQDLHEQLEQTFVEYKTFENLRQHEVGAMPKRMEVRGKKQTTELSLQMSKNFQYKQYYMYVEKSKTRGQTL